MRSRGRGSLIRLLSTATEPLIYRCGFAIEKHNKELDILEVEPVKHAFYNINSMMKKILSTTECDQYYGYLTSSDKSNFRFSIFPDYKANRKDARKPIHYDELRQFMQKRWNAEMVYGQEADDACSIMHCSLNNLGFDMTIHNSVICSFDKDFNNVPGWHYNYVKDEVYYVDETEALQNFYLQILTGDNSDGIPRIKKGWKKKDAEEKIRRAKTEDEMVEIVYKELSSVLEKNETCAILDILEKRGQLVWLRRTEGELWTPNIKHICNT